MESKVNKMPVGFLAAWENAHLYAPLQFLYLLVLQRQLSELLHLLLLKLRLFRAFFVAIFPLLLVISMLVVCGHAFLSRHVRKMKRRHKKRGIIKNFGYVVVLIKSLIGRRWFVFFYVFFFYNRLFFGLERVGDSVAVVRQMYPYVLGNACFV